MTDWESPYQLAGRIHFLLMFGGFHRIVKDFREAYFSHRDQWSYRHEMVFQEVHTRFTPLDL